MRKICFSVSNSTLSQLFVTRVSRALTEDRVQKLEKCEISYICRRCGSRLRVQQPDKVWIVLQALNTKITKCVLG